MIPSLSAKAIHCKSQYMKLRIFGIKYFYRQAGDRVSAIYCIGYSVEGKPGLNIVDRIVLYYNSLLLETRFLRKLHSRVFCSAVELALERSNLLYIGLLSFRLNEFLDYED